MTRNRTSRNTPVKSDDSDKSDQPGKAELIAVLDTVVQSESPKVSELAEKSHESAESAKSESPDESAKSDKPAKFDLSTLNLDEPDEVRKSYQSGTRGDKAAIRTFVTKAMYEAIDSLEDVGPQIAMERASALKALLQSLVTVQTIEPKPVDYVQIVAQRLLSYQIATNALEAGEVDGLPEGVELDPSAIQAKLYELAASDESSQIALEAAKRLNSFKWGKSSKHDIAAHIREWADSVESGTFAKVSEIAKFRSNEYGDDNPSDGAVSAHLFGNGPDKDNYVYGDRSDMTGVVPVEATATVARGARKI